MANKSATGVRELHTSVMPRWVGVENRTRRQFWHTCANVYHQFRG
jgi:hypothetical protein